MPPGPDGWAAVPQPSTLLPQPSTLYPQPSSPHPQPTTEERLIAKKEEARKAMGDYDLGGGGYVPPPPYI